MSVITRKEELFELYSLPLEKLVAMSSQVLKDNFDNSVEFCSIISAKTGKCGENCKYCAQSSHYRTNIETHPLVTVEDVRKAALESRNNGANRFSIVTSGKSPEEKDFPQILKMIEEVNSIEGLSACASLGFLTEKQAQGFKNAGLRRYHHNINTCNSYYKDVCTTHSYADRIDTINMCKSAGLEVCVGVIIGMGETREQRVEIAMELAEINPESVPVNFLHPIEGTPFGNYHDKITSEEIIRTLAMFRMALPKTNIRYAGGRFLKLTKEEQALGLKAGANGILIGNLLTTIGITPEEDKELVESVGMKVKND